MTPSKRNNLKELREAQLLSKAELARRAGISTLTVDRVEAGLTCRLDTKRKIILALGMTVADKERVFGTDPDDPGQEEAGEQSGTHAPSASAAGGPHAPVEG